MGIYKRNGKYEIRLTIRGVKYYRQVPEAQNDVDAKVAEATLIRELYEGRYGKEGKEIGATDFVKYCKEVYKPTVQTYLKNWKHEFYNVDTLCRYARVKRLKDITRIEVEKYRKRRLADDSKRGRPRKPITVRGEIATLSHIFNLAIEDELISLTPCRKIKWKAEDIESHRERMLSYEEEARLMQHLSGETRAAVIIALNTGLRRMGILRRKVEDVDLNQRIVRNIAKGGKKRIVPLNAKALEVIKELIQNATPEGYLFHNRKGYSLSWPGCAFRRAVERAGIDDFTFHDLRYTFATRVKKYTDPYTVRDLVAHADIKQTGEYITRPIAEMRQAVDALCEGKVLDFHRRSGKTEEARINIGCKPTLQTSSSKVTRASLAHFPRFGRLRRLIFFTLQLFY